MCKSAWWRTWAVVISEEKYDYNASCIVWPADTTCPCPHDQPPITPLLTERLLNAPHSTLPLTTLFRAYKWKKWRPLCRYNLHSNHIHFWSPWGDEQFYIIFLKNRQKYIFRFPWQRRFFIDHTQISQYFCNKMCEQQGIATFLSPQCLCHSKPINFISNIFSKVASQWCWKSFEAIHWNPWEMFIFVKYREKYFFKGVIQNGCTFPRSNVNKTSVVDVD